MLIMIVIFEPHPSGKSNLYTESNEISKHRGKQRMRTLSLYGRSSLWLDRNTGEALEANWLNQVRIEPILTKAIEIPDKLSD